MKKAVMGLVGVVIGCVGLGGCQTELGIDEQAKGIIYHYNAMKKVAGVKPKEAFEIYDFKEGLPFRVFIKGEKGTKCITFYDTNKDGEYDKKETLTIPKKLDMRIFPAPKKAEPNDVPEQYRRKKPLPKKNARKKLVYNW